MLPSAVAKDHTAGGRPHSQHQWAQAEDVLQLLLKVTTNHVQSSRFHFGPTTSRQDPAIYINGSTLAGLSSVPILTFQSLRVWRRSRSKLESSVYKN